MALDKDVHHYRNGGCFAMAKALHRLTGYQERCIDFGNYTHAFVVSESGSVLDVHGEHAWGEFLNFLVGEGAFSSEEVVLGKVAHMEIPGDESIYWRHRGYKDPSETAIKRASSVAKRIFGRNCTHWKTSKQPIHKREI
jgi:hypothetical protein